MNKIYIIKNNINDKVYIGKTQLTIEQRFKEHCRDYLKREEEKRPLYNAMKKYGIQNFYIELIEDNISDEDVNEKEIFYIKKYNSYIGFEETNGYNATLGGDGKNIKIGTLIKYGQGKNYTEIANILKLDRTYIGKLLKNNGIEIKNCADLAIEKCGKIVYQLDIETHKIINIYPSVGQANIALGKSRENGTLGDALRARRGHHKAYNFLWFYEEDYKKLILNKNFEIE